MGKKIRAIFIAIVMLSLTIGYFAPAAAQIENSWYCPETDHTVSGEFLKKYNEATNATLIYGFPITDAFLSPGSTITVQYFQKARFEQHPENPPDQRIVVYPLGEYWFTKDNPPKGQRLPDNYPACRVFPKTGNQVCYAFLEFYDQNGGLAQFGNPLSDVVQFRGRLVQYFEYARFEWQPDYPSGQRVVLSNLGLSYFQTHENQEYALSPKTDAAPLLGSVISLRINAFVKSAVVTGTGQQTIYVIVQDQSLRSIPDAQVLLTITLPSGAKRQVSSKLTNSDGFTSFTFALNEKNIGTANVEVTVNYSNIAEKTTWTTFRIWY